jgi:phage-related protein
MNPSNPDSPLRSIASSLDEVGKRLNFDPEPLRKLQPDALLVMRNAIPSDTLEFVHSIEKAYREAQEFLQNSALAREIKPGATLQDVALAAVKDVLRVFDEQQLQLHQNLIDPEMLADFQAALAAYEQFRTDFNAHRADFLPFITRQLFGVAPDLLREPLQHLASAMSVLSPLDPQAIEALLKSAQQNLAQTFRELSELITTFNPSDATAYVQINVRLNALETAITGIQTAVAPLYGQLQTVVDSHAWDTILPEYTRLLKAITIDTPPSIDEAIHSLSVIIEGIQGRLQTFFGPQEIVTRMEALSRELYQLFADSAVGQVRRVLREFLEKIRDAIASVPTEEVQKAIEEMLGRVKQELDELGIEKLAETIEKGFKEAEDFITEHINDALKNDVTQAVEGLLDNLKNLPLETLFSHITTAMDRVQALLDELNTALTEGVDDVKAVLAKLEELSFKPVSDVVVGEIDDLKKRVQAINPNALSDPEKLAIKAALAFLEGIHVEDIIEQEAKKGFNEAKEAVKPLLDQLETVLDNLRDRLEAYRPERFVASLVELLDKAEDVVSKLDAKAMLKPLYEQVDEFVKQLEAVSPGSLLDPLQQPYQSVVAAVNQLNPTQIIAPLNQLYAEVDKLISYVDVTPLFDELDKRQKELFKNARTALLAALNQVTLPEPLKEFYDGVRPILEAMTDALFQDPDTAFQNLNSELSKRLQITSLFKPLDKVFDELMRTVASVPADDLVSVFETIRKTLGTGIDALDPRLFIEAFRRGQRQLDELSPHLLLALPLSLPSLKIAFQARVTAAPPARAADVAAVTLRFDAVIHLTAFDDPQSPIINLQASHNALAGALRRRVNAFEVSEAEAAYGRMREQLVKVLPDFLRRTVELTHAEVTAGLESLRPSRKAGELQAILDRFEQQLRPMQTQLQEAGQKFFRAIRDTLELLNPLSLKDAVADIYQTIRQKVRILDPARLAASLSESIFEPVMKALGALDPATLKARLNEAYSKVLDAVVNSIKPILDSIANALDEQLKRVQAEVKKVFDELKETIDKATKIFQDMVKQVEDLVFVEVLERLRRVLDNLGVSFDRELSRIRNAFDQMLAALPLDIGNRNTATSTSV